MAPKFRTSAALITAAILSSACSGEIHRKSTLGTYKYLSIDARQRLVTTHTITDPETGYRREILCTEPSPNVFVARAAAAAANGNRSGGASGATTGGGAGVASSESASGIGARTQTIELLRDAYYRACEGYGNGIIGKDDYRTIIANIDSTMIALAAIDALGGTTLAGNNALASSGVNVNVSGAENTGGGTVNITPGTPIAGSNSPSKAITDPAAAEALRAIALYSLATAKTRTDFLGAIRLLKTRDGKISRADAHRIANSYRNAGPNVNLFKGPHKHQ